MTIAIGKCHVNTTPLALGNANNHAYHENINGVIAPSLTFKLAKEERRLKIPPASLACNAKSRFKTSND